MIPNTRCENTIIYRALFLIVTIILGKQDIKYDVQGKKKTAQEQGAHITRKNKGPPCKKLQEAGRRMRGPAVMIGANLRLGSGGMGTQNVSVSSSPAFQCHPGGTTEAAIIFCLGSLGMAANFALMVLILTKRQLRSVRDQPQPTRKKDSPAHGKSNDSNSYMKQTA
ncbi:hypothetical protein FOCC_FOCC006897 [Frankliniella occidentalis]|nr:hypothetical protein FOCC_FOCC006897 [Frankliniella occidentalis]